MGTRVVPVRLKEETIRGVDLLVKLGIFSSRGEALRELVKMELKNPGKHVRIAEAVKEIFKLEEEAKDIPIKLPGALKQLLEGRDRFS